STYTLSLHDALPIFRQEANGCAAFHERAVASKDFCSSARRRSETKNNFQRRAFARAVRSEQSVNFACFDAQIEIAYGRDRFSTRSEEHTSELQSLRH